jgi:hypothetical protein
MLGMASLSRDVSDRSFHNISSAPEFINLFGLQPTAHSIARFHVQFTPAESIDHIHCLLYKQSRGDHIQSVTPNQQPHIVTTSPFGTQKVVCLEFCFLNNCLTLLDISMSPEYISCRHQYICLYIHRFNGAQSETCRTKIMLRI